MIPLLFVGRRIQTATDHFEFRGKQPYTISMDSSSETQTHNSGRPVILYDPATSPPSVTRPEVADTTIVYLRDC